jgi:hypothetical protein
MNKQETKDFIKNHNGTSGRMYNEKYVKNNYLEIYNEIIEFCINLNIPFKEKVYHYVNDIGNNVLCKNPNCENPTNYHNSTLGYNDYCSIQCISSDQKIKDIKEKKSYEKYGTKAPGMNSEIKQKTISTNNEKYGSNSPLQNKEIKQKSQDTLFKNYGVDNPNKSNILLKKRVITFSNNMRKKFLEIYKNIGLYDIDYKKKKMFLKCEKGHEYELELDLFHNRRISNTILCVICNPIDKHISGCELQLQDFINENYDGIKILNNRTTLKPFELDVYLPDLKLAFEFNGLFYHSEKCISNNYHSNKTEDCEKQDIQLIQIYEDDWVYKYNIVISRILNLLGKTSEKIYGRKCIIKEISDNNLIREFLEKNHIQGFVGSQIKLGLFYNEELVSLMTFGKQRKSMGIKSQESVYEMLRFCNKLNTSVVGGADKLFKYFIKTYNPIEVISYADRSWSRGDLYYKLGFELVHKTQPNYYYIVNRLRKNRFLYRKDVLIKQGYDSIKTERVIMLERKIYRIYDSGSLKFIYTNKI